MGGVNDDQTEYQTAGGQSTSQKLSMQATAPPAQVPGYRLTQFLGAGAFGQVWVGRNLNTGRDVAVKFYLHRGGVNWSLLSREVKNLVQLSADRYVVQVLEVGWDADPPYYVMELVTGGSLEDLLQMRGRLPLTEAVDMFRKICTGLNRCHAKGVLHCDVKPANILLGDDHEPRLADFGQSRLSDDQTPTLGTLFYMAPEQADLRSSPDASWDVYAVGAIMYRMLVGQPPYRDEKVVEQLDTAGSLQTRLERYRQAIEISPAPAEHLQLSDVDRSLGRIVSKCLAADPSDRYANMQQILQDLNRRDNTRARRPLMLLGIVGPLLVLFATSFFAARSIRRASISTMDALRDEAFSSNQLAATFAARTLENEIDGYYRLVREEASRPEFVQKLIETLDSEGIQQALDEISSMPSPAATHGEQNVARERLLDHPIREQLTATLQKNLKLYSGDDPEARRLATMFVTDPKGTIISIAYNEEDIDRMGNSAGRNYSYRTYYHGGPEDLSAENTTIGQKPPLTWTHLSSAFESTATRLWKLAVSTPIYLTDDHSEPDALFVVTIDLGDFKLLQGTEGNQVAVLVYARQGPQQGIILQHPFLDQRRGTGVKMEGVKYQIPSGLMQRLLVGGDVDYTDPFADADDSGQYAGPWIAAMEPVSVPTQPPKHDAADPPQTPPVRATDLLVMVQYRLEKVFEPVDRMRTMLFWEGAAAIASILVVTLTLWGFVRRVGSSNGDRRRSEEKHHHVAETVSVQ